MESIDTITPKVGYSCMVGMCSFNGDPIAFLFWTSISLSLDMSVIASVIFCFLSLSKEAIRFVTSILTSLVLCMTLKHIFRWERLYEECGGSDPSMPSGHTMMAVFIAAYLYILWSNDYSRLAYYRTTIICIWSALVGTARVYLGYHRETEVFVGFCLGLICAWTSHRFWQSSPWRDFDAIQYFGLQKTEERSQPDLINNHTEDETRNTFLSSLSLGRRQKTTYLPIGNV